MTQKAISFSTAAAILIVYLWSQLQPNAPLFLLISPSRAINLSLLAIAVLAVRMSFINKFKTKLGYLMVAAGALFLTILSAAAVGLSIFNYYLFNWLGSLDFVLLGELGIILAIFALSYQHQPIELNVMAKLSQLKPSKLAWPKPTFPRQRLAWHSFRNLYSGQ